MPIDPELPDTSVSHTLTEGDLQLAAARGVLDRRTMLKTMALSAAGVVGAGLGVGATAAPVLAATGGGIVSPTVRPAVSVTPAALAAPTAGTTYKSLTGINFIPDSTASGYGLAGSSLRNESGTTGFAFATVDLPHGAKITELAMNVLHNDTNSMIVGLDGVNVNINGYSYIGTSVNVTTQSASVQTIAIPTTPTVVDRTINDYFFYVQFGTAGSTQVIYGARAGYTLNPGLVTFASPQRVFDGFATPVTNGTTYGPIDATKLAGTTTASGVPAGAKAIYAAVQVQNNPGPGRATIYPDGTANPNIANWTAVAGGNPSLLSMTYMLVPLSAAGKFQLAAYIDGNLSVDAWGYVV